MAGFPVPERAVAPRQHIAAILVLVERQLIPAVVLCAAHHAPRDLREALAGKTHGGQGIAF